MNFSDFLNLKANPSFGLTSGIWFALLIIWSIAWKGWAMWRAARRSELIWYLVFLVINTAGILEIIYLFLITKGKEEKTA